MKKITRFLSFVVLLSIAFSLCGCSYLDELREARGLLTPEGTVVLNGTEYKLLPENKSLSPLISGDLVIYAVEDEEIPLLLTGYYGDYFLKSEDGAFLCRSVTGIMTYYCREDLYDSVLARIENGFTPELYCYSYYDYGVYEESLYTLTPQQAEAIEEVLATREPFTLPAGTKLDYDYQVQLYRYSSDYIFRDNSVSVGFADGTFYLVENWELVYTVPNSMYVTFARMVKKYLE